LDEEMGERLLCLFPFFVIKTKSFQEK